MATLPHRRDSIAQFGPHLNYPPREGYPGRDEPDKIVETHCCFCGHAMRHQAARSKTTRSSVSSRGKTSRSTKAGFVRKASSVTFRTIIPTGCCTRLERAEGTGASGASDWEQALSRTVVARSSASRPNTATTPSRCSPGVSLTNEKSYLVGKFARLALHTAQSRLQWPAVHGRRRRRQQESVRHRPRLDQLLERPPARRSGDGSAGTNVSETFPITTDCSGRRATTARSSSSSTLALTPIARTADLHSAGPARPRFGALSARSCTSCVKHDWLDHEFIDNHTSGFDEAAAAVEGLRLRTGLSGSLAFRQRKSCAPPSGGARRRPAS